MCTVLLPSGANPIAVIKYIFIYIYIYEYICIKAVTGAHKYTKIIILAIDQLSAQILVFLISLLYSSTCFEHCCAHHQEVKLYYTASGVVTLCRWLSGAQVDLRTGQQNCSCSLQQATTTVLCTLMMGAMDVRNM